MAEKQALDHTMIKTNTTEEGASDFGMIISPRKAARMQRSLKRKEEVQAAIAILGSGIVIDEEGLGSVDDVDGQDGKDTGKKAGMKKFLSDKSDKDSKGTESEKRSEARAKVDGLESLTKMKDKEKKLENKAADNSIKTALGYDFKTPENETILRKSCAVPPKIDSVYTIKSNSKLGENAVKVETPKSKRKGRTPKKLTAGIESQNSHLDTTVRTGSDSLKDISPIKPGSTDGTGVTQGTPESKSKKRGRPKKDIAIKAMNSSVAEIVYSVLLEKGSFTMKSEAKDKTKTNVEDKTEKIKPETYVKDKTKTIKSETNVGDNTGTPNTEKPKTKKRGRPSSSVKKEKKDKVSEVLESTPKSSRRIRIDYAAMSKGETKAELIETPKFRGKSKKVEQGSIDDGEIDEPTEKTPKSTKKQNAKREVTDSAPKSSRKRKRVDYAAFSKGEDDDDDKIDFDTDDNKTPVTKRRKIKIENDDETDNDTDDYLTPVPKGRRKKVDRQVVMEYESDAEDVDYADETHQKKTPSTKSEIKGKQSKAKVELKCCKCDSSFKRQPDLVKHMAIKHQALWTPENPEGLDDPVSLRQVIKMRKFLNCPKCDKQLNFLQYYKQHLEWCGRENETFTCPICHHDGLLAKWRDMHIRTCERNQLQKEEAIKRSVELLKKEEEEDNMEEIGEGGKKKKKRRAAKRASTMLHNLSQDKDIGLEGDLDDSDNDRNFRVTASDEDEEVPEEYEEDEEENEEENKEDESDVDEESIIAVTLESSSRKWRRRRPGNTNIETYFSKYYLTYPLMSVLMKQHMSKPLYPDLVPLTQDWTPISSSTSENYLPAPDCHSICFTFSKKSKTLQSLKLYESVTVNDFPMFFTGLSVWKMAWCPTLRQKPARQYLAIVGKTDRDMDFSVHTRVTAPGSIQIWDTGIESNELKQDSVPRLACNIIHAYGIATDVKWCPSGCWQEDNMEDKTHSVLPRIGLLACSFTDSTIRIFSIPHVPDTKPGTIPSFRPTPVVTLVPHSSWESSSITCSCLDWQSLHGHSQIVAGYSDGTLRVYNLLTTSSLQLLKPSPSKVLLPYRSFQAHLGLVQSCAWAYKDADRVVSAGEDSNIHFWDLKDVSQPFNTESGAFLPARVINNVMFPGVITSSDDAYSVNQNKSRYLDLPVPLVEKESKTAFATSQSACVWDISYSNWLNFVVSCDSRGTVTGTPWYDLPRVDSDTKLYRQRVILAEAKVKWKSSSVTSDIECQCKSDQSESCSKCGSQSETICDKKSNGASNNDSDMDHSGSLLESDPLTNQSEDLTKKPIGGSEKSVTGEKTSVECSQSDQTEKPKRWKDKSLLTLKSLRDDQNEEGKDAKTYSEMLEKSYLEFSEYLTEKNRKQGPVVDTEFDVYDRVFVNSLHTIAFNPNKPTCFWVAYGGESGLVRLVNILHRLPKKFTSFYKMKESL